MLLSGLLPHPCDSVELEQYTTDGDLAARWLTDISAFGDLTEGCTVADLGAGNGVLGLGEIGREMAGRASAFSMKVLYHQRNRLPEEIETQGIKHPLANQDHTTVIDVVGGVVHENYGAEYRYQQA